MSLPSHCARCGGPLPASEPLAGQCPRCLVEIGIAETTGKLALPAKLGRYEIHCLLARGGMGAVYRGLDTRLNRPVAVKFLSEELGDTAARRRFQREAQMASSL